MSGHDFHCPVAVEVAEVDAEGAVSVALVARVSAQISGGQIKRAVAVEIAGDQSRPSS